MKCICFNERGNSYNYHILLVRKDVYCGYARAISHSYDCGYDIEVLLDGLTNCQEKKEILELKMKELKGVYTEFALPGCNQSADYVLLDSDGNLEENGYVYFPPNLTRTISPSIAYEIGYKILSLVRENDFQCILSTR